MSDEGNREFLVSGPTRRQVITRAGIALSGLALSSTLMLAEGEGEISRTAEAIHLEPVFKASRKRIYEALTDSKQFDGVVRRSAAMKSMQLGNKPSEISAEAGGTFALFGGYVTGRQIELVPNERIVQA